MTHIYPGQGENGEEKGIRDRCCDNRHRKSVPDTFSSSAWTPKQAGDYFGWAGQNVTKKASDFTKEELVSHGFTKEVLQEMASIYETIAATPSSLGNFNPSALGRAQQLREILDLLF